ncbi:methylated-DNA--[protein]-cysteine S-methyltransferase [Dokdonia donghaensis]|uniref:Methylated-DNA--protein-cysteine methyltransferase n=1 Tax=Dokdonia donghaensis DSW-1 TaxID=1300343 RepID=A0A0A2GWH0_9FLAO|nr:methylated-DNA--[protein]-cysteine S-methyltransferase [Dokdonia donghaensis]ANH59464.1 Methylated-DNA--protein-cysteine methyltransferase [Dokdonia donghaensis DSW-1]KGO06848.1 cysteine methyltransferase [Dokdonia donghaensis DSW-1]
METAIILTPIGLLSLEGNREGLCAATFIEDGRAVTKVIPNALQEAVKQLKEYFSGERTTFSLKLDPLGTDFQRRVWRELETIPFGKTTSYLAMAKQLGDPKVIRAAASANGKNPISIIIPCHRVIGSDGSLTGYAGGLHRKKWLLEHESPVTQGSLF